MVDQDEGNDPVMSEIYYKQNVIKAVYLYVEVSRICCCIFRWTSKWTLLIFYTKILSRTFHLHLRIQWDLWLLSPQQGKHNLRGSSELWSCFISWQLSFVGRCSTMFLLPLLSSSCSSSPIPHHSGKPLSSHQGQCQVSITSVFTSTYAHSYENLFNHQLSASTGGNICPSLVMRKQTQTSEPFLNQMKLRHLPGVVVFNCFAEWKKN